MSRLQTTEARLRHVATLLRVSRAVTSTLDLTEALRRLSREMVRALGADTGGAWVLDPTGDRFLPFAGYHVPKPVLEVFSRASVSSGDRLVEELRRLRGPVWWGDPGDRRRPDHPLVHVLPHRSALVQPIRFRRERIGGFAVAWLADAHRFTAAELLLTDAIARQAAVAIQNARLHEQARREREWALALEEGARDIASTMDRDEVFRRIVNLARRLCASDMAFFESYDEKSGTARLVAASGAAVEVAAPLVITSGRGASGRVLQTREAFATGDYLNDPRISRDYADFAHRLGIAALAVVPVRFGGAITGLLTAANRSAQGFAPRQVGALGALANHAAIALENSRLYAEAEELARRRERNRLGAELHDALGQTLFSAGLRLDRCLARLPAGHEVRATLEEVKHDVGVMMRQARELVCHLDPGDVPDLSRQFASLIQDFRELTGLPVDFREVGDPTRLGEPQQRVLQRVLQEALVNVAKHARATCARVRVEVSAEEALLEVADDGAGATAGADVSTLAEAPGHFGLRQMAERVQEIGGRAEFGASVPSGFRVRVTVPTR